MEKNIEHILANYFSGEASGKEKKMVEDWCTSDPENQLLFDKARSYWHGQIEETFPRDMELSYNQLLARISPARKRTIVTSRLIRWLGAAVFILFIGFTGYFAGNYAVQAPVHYYTYTSGEIISTFYLPDSTEVVLNKHSTLTYSSLYGNNTREVALQGEGYFRVTGNRDQPFVIDLEEASVEVLGTVFYVKNYPGDAYTTTYLVEGCVAFEVAGQRTLMKPSEFLTFHRQKNSVDLQLIDEYVEAAWKDHLIRYRSISFSELVQLLSKEYNVRIHIADSGIANQIVSGAFDMYLPMEQILNILQKNLSFTYRKEKDVYLIEK